MDVEPSGLTTVGLPALEGRGGGEHAGGDEAALPPPVPVPVPALLEAAGADADEAAIEEEAGAAGEAEEDAATVGGEICSA